MAITGIDANRIIEHALGGTPIDRTSSNAGVALANDVGHWLLDTRSWNWASGARATLDLTAGQSYITLPADFQEFIGEPYRTDGLTGGFEWISLVTLVEIAVEAPLASTDYFFGALAWDQAGAGAPVARIEIHPPPNETVVGVLTCFYRRGWTDLPSPADTTVAKIPAWMEGLYTAALEAYARGWEDGIQDPGIRQRYLQSVLSGPEWAAATHRDAIAQPNKGVIKNGVISPRLRHWSRLAGTSAPT